METIVWALLTFGGIGLTVAAVLAIIFAGGGDSYVVTFDPSAGRR